MIQLPVTYTASRRKMLLLLGISLAFVAIGVWLYQDPEERLMAGLGIGFFGLCGLVGLISLHPRAAYLTLNEQGFEFCSLFRKHFIAWRDVQEFVPISMSGNAMVGFFYVPGSSAPKMRHVSNFIAGVEAALPDTYGHKNVELAQLLNELRRKYGVR